MFYWQFVDVRHVYIWIAECNCLRKSANTIIPIVRPCNIQYNYFIFCNILTFQTFYLLNRHANHYSFSSLFLPFDSSSLRGFEGQGNSTTESEKQYFHLVKELLRVLWLLKQIWHISLHRSTARKNWSSQQLWSLLTFL